MPMTRPASPLIRKDHAALMPCFAASLAAADQSASFWIFCVMRSCLRCTAEPQVMLPSLTSTKSRHNLNESDRLGACSTDKVLFFASSCIIAALKSSPIFSTKRHIARNVLSCGVLAAIISSTLFCAKENSSLRLRSAMSVMLTRISRCSSDGRRLKRTSQGSSLPVESLCIHSNVGCSPASARSMKPRRTPNDGVPSGCVSGLIASGPIVINRARDKLNKRQALSLASIKRLLSTSKTMMVSGAFSTSAR